MKKLLLNAIMGVLLMTTTNAFAARKNFDDKIIVTPLPVFIIATYDANNIPNAMTASWGGQIGYHEVDFHVAAHKTTENLELNKAFTLSFADKKNVAIADYFGMESGWNVNKIEKAGVHTYKSNFVNAPVIEEFPLTLECVVTDMQKEPNGDIRVIGKVLNMSADESILDENGNIDVGKLEPISYDQSKRIYRILGEKVGNTFQDGLQIKNK